MATTKTFAGTTYQLPLNREPKGAWGTQVSNFLIAVADYAIPRTGGTHTLTAELNLGATYGVVSAYLKSVTANISTAGVVRLANNEGIGWRNQANGADLVLKVDSGNRLDFNGSDVVTADSTDTLTGKTIDGGSNTLTNIAASSLASTTGSGAVVLASSPTLTTPNLGTPSAATLTNATGLPLSTGVTGTLPVANGGTGVTSSTGSGNVVLSTSPTLTTPNLGTPSAATLTNATGLPLSTGVTGTLPLANGGTGQTSANNALNALLPSQASNSGKYLKSDGSNTSWASAAGGAGELNAILNASGADGTTGWTGATVVSGASSPLNPVVTTAFSISNAATTESSTSGGYYPFTLPSGMMNRKLKVEFTFTTPATDVYAVSVYKSTTRVALSTDSSSVTTLPASVTGGKFVAYFDTDTSSSWTLSVTRTSGSTGACVITNVIVGPGIQPQGAVVGPSTSYTLTIGGVTTPPTPGTATSTAAYARVGDQLRLTYSFRQTSSAGAAAGSGIYLFPLPSGLTLDTTRLGQLALEGNSILGTAEINNGTTTLVGVVLPYNSTNLMIQVGNDTTAPTFVSSTFYQVNTNATLRYSFEATVPIAEWAGSGTVNVAQNDVEYAYNTSGITAAGASDTTAFGYGPQGALIGSINSSTTTGVSSTTFRVQFQTPIQPNDLLVVETDEGTSGARWVPLHQNNHAPIVQYLSQYGVSLSLVSATQVSVAFGNAGRFPGNVSYAGAGNAWSNVSSYRWRVRKSSAGAAVGFGEVQPGVSSGLVSASGLKGRTDGGTVAAGYVGQKLETATPADGGLPTSNQWGDITSLSLTAGVWLLTGVAAFGSGGSTFSSTIDLGLGTASGNDGTGFVLGDNGIRLTAASGSGYIGGSVSWFFNTASTQTIYLKTRATYSGGTPLARGLIRAVRIA